MTQQDHIKENAEHKQSVRRKILAIGHSLNWGEPESPEDYNWPRWKVNMKRINRWVLKYGIHKKEINDMTLTELIETCTQFQRVANNLIYQKYKPKEV